jgi:cytochrome c-type biogenesis protein CcsB
MSSPQFLNLLRNFSFFFLFVSLIIYWIQTAFGNFSFFKFSKKKGSFGSEFAPGGNSKILASPSLLPSALGVSVLPGDPWLSQKGKASKTKKKQKLTLGTLGIILANSSMFLLLILRWKESGHFPLSNLYESLIFLSWTCTVFHLFLESYTQNTFIGCITAPSALFTNAFATFSLPPEMQQSSPLVPALQSNWLMMHVTVMILSYAALICGSLLSIAFLIVTREFTFNPSSTSEVLAPWSASSGPLALASSPRPLAVSDGESLKIKGDGEPKPFDFSQNFSKNIYGFEKKKKLAETLDNLSYRILGMGFPFLTIGILSGAVWANEAWGSYWSWDPKETWAFLTWLVFAIYLHTRLTKGWQGQKPALIASVGFVVVWLCFLGVNLLGEGLHSYGFLAKN